MLRCCIIWSIGQSFWIITIVSMQQKVSQAMDCILVYVTLCQFSFSPSPAVTIFTRFTSLTRLIGFSRLTSFSHKSTHNYPKTSLLMYNCTNLGLKGTLALVEPLSYTFLFQVPISPKFEANFWPDERLEQVKRQSCRTLDPPSPPPSGEPAEKKPSILWQQF